MLQPVMRKVKGDGITINVAEWEGSGNPILCLHGITANCRCWDHLASILAPRYRLIAMDLRGRGQSDRPPSGYGLAYHMNDINHLMDDLGLEHASLMGHSLGAFLSLGFSAQYPDRVDQLVLVDGGGDLSQEQMDRVFAGIKPSLDRLTKMFASVDEYLAAMRSAAYIQPWTSDIETYYRYEIEAVKDGVKTNIDPVHIMEEATNVRNLSCASFYPQVRCPVLVLRAPNGLLSQADILLPEVVIDAMLEAFPNAQRFDVTGVNHYGIVFQPHPARDQALLDFFEGSF